MRIELLLATTLVLTAASAQDPAMIRGVGWRTDVVTTVGDTFNGYLPMGVPDGIGCFPIANSKHVLVLLNNELDPNQGFSYKLKNGTELTGGRVTEYVVERVGSRAVVHSARLAYDVVYDRKGKIVTSPSQVNETGKGKDGMAGLCSCIAIRAGEHGFVDDLLFTAEEIGVPDHPHGGSMWVLERKTRTLYALPDLGRGEWENVSPIATGNNNTIALLMGDDSPTAPLYLYVGQKKANGTFLERNGLVGGSVYVWVTDNGDTTPQQFNTSGNRTGKFVQIAIKDASMAGKAGHDSAGYINNDLIRKKAFAMKAFQFSRPEDVAPNPKNGRQHVFAATGHQTFPKDIWGTLFLVEVTPGTNYTAKVTILHDADGLTVPDTGIRNPDNVEWARNGKIYVQADRKFPVFGKATAIDASVWEIDPVTHARTRIGIANRTVLLPVGVSDSLKNELGAWETTGIVDVTHLFPTKAGETLLLTAIQCDSVEDGPIKTRGLVQSGQVMFMSSEGIDHGITCKRLTGGGTQLDAYVTNGMANHGYVIGLAAQHFGNAPKGWFFGIDVAFSELGLLIFGKLDGKGESRITVRFPQSTCPIGLNFDAVVVEIGANGLARRSGPATSHRL